MKTKGNWVEEGAVGREEEEKGNDIGWSILVYWMYPQVCNKSHQRMMLAKVYCYIVRVHKYVTNPIIMY